MSKLNKTTIVITKSHNTIGAIYADQENIEVIIVDADVMFKDEEPHLLNKQNEAVTVDSQRAIYDLDQVTEGKLLNCFPYIELDRETSFELAGDRIQAIHNEEVETRKLPEGVSYQVIQDFIDRQNNN
ncbi:hypothetical protein [Vibrio barjaei]|uniref:hypothetical protein n=1 Tax=Vibrio barjaei TaxID=1676683 RepID=UPI002283FD1A|nr:hypothetical protein [Vibrio barjaei]MCY9870474.1 hypothetical protein [Vibrio barjaei]